jgi:transposase
MTQGGGVRVMTPGMGRRRWDLDLRSAKVFLEADAPRVRCRYHGLVVAFAA